MRYILLGLAIIIAALTPAIMAAVVSIHKAGLQQQAEDEKVQAGYKEPKHPYIRAQKYIVAYAAERLKYQLLERGKSCKACCLRCRLYPECSKYVRAKKERQRKSEKLQDR